MKSKVRSELVIDTDTLPDANVIGIAMNTVASGEIIQVDIGEGSYGWQEEARIIDGIPRYKTVKEIKAGDWVMIADIDPNTNESLWYSTEREQR